MSIDLFLLISALLTGSMTWSLLKVRNIQPHQGKAFFVIINGLASLVFFVLSFLALMSWIFNGTFSGPLPPESAAIWARLFALYSMILVFVTFPKIPYWAKNLLNGLKRKLSRLKPPHITYPEILDWRKNDRFVNQHGHPFFLDTITGDHIVNVYRLPSGNEKVIYTHELAEFVLNFTNKSLEQREVEKQTNAKDHYSEWLETTWEAREEVLNGLTEEDLAKH